VSGGRRRAAGGRRRGLWLVVAGAVVIIAASAVVAIGRDHGPAGEARAAASASGPLAARPGSYLGVYQSGAPDSYAGLTAFSRATGVRPGLVSYYSGWLEPFRAGFAATAARHGAVPLVQLEPAHVRLAAIAAGRYDAYLRGYAAAVRAYQRPVILSFCHEMNAWWYSWGYRDTSPATFIAAWRHVVTLFRAAGARNVTWLWTVNVIDARGGIRAPGAWWPGRSYVNWIGLDGYYKRAGAFAPLFGPTIAAVRALARDPVLIAETGVAPAADKPAQITNLFAGVRAYGLVGLVWFNAVGIRDWRLDTPAATAAFRRGAAAYGRAAT
jgi:mannan endo-1,4-beta-mannosidase